MLLARPEMHNEVGFAYSLGDLESRGEVHKRATCGFVFNKSLSTRENLVVVRKPYLVVHHTFFQLCNRAV